MSENTNPEHSETTSQPSIDPGAFDRVKRERDQAKQEVEQAKSALAATLLVDTLYGHFKDKKVGDAYQLAKEAAGYPDIARSENPAEAADAWLQRISGLLGSQNAEPAPKPPPPMAAVNPAATGVQVETGPFQVGSKEWKQYVDQHGMAAAYKAIGDGQFFLSSANQEAQKTAALY